MATWHSPKVLQDVHHTITFTFIATFVTYERKRDEKMKTARQIDG